MQLVINTFGATLRKEGDRFVITAGSKILAISAHRVQSILISTAAFLSTDAVEFAATHNIDLVFLSKHGDPYGRLWQSRMGGTAAIRRRQIDTAPAPLGNC
jgi:CRISPR-associated protein Cas1